MKFNSQICTSRNKGGGVIKHHKVYALKGNEFYELFLRTRNAGLCNALDAVGTTKETD